MVEDSRTQIARTSLLVQSFPAQHMDRLLGMSRFRTYRRGDTLFLQGEPARAIHVVIEGWVKLYRVAPNGGEAVVSVFARGESFGEAVAFKSAPYPVSAEAVSACEVMQIPSDPLLDLMRQDPEIGVSLLSATFSHLHALVGQLEQLKAQTGPQRVAAFLLALCGQEDGRAVITLPYDKVLIAGRLGMKPETLSRAFARLRPQGLVVSGNHATIADVARLREFATSDPAETR